MAADSTCGRLAICFACYVQRISLCSNTLNFRHQTNIKSELPVAVRAAVCSQELIFFVNTIIIIFLTLHKDEIFPNN